MALLLLLSLFLCNLVFTSTHFSWTLEKKFDTVNHAATVEAINNFMSYDSSILTQTENMHGGIPIYHKNLFIKGHFRDYKSLILFNLAHDFKRSEQLSAVLDKAKYVSLFQEGGGSCYIAILNAGTPPQRLQLAVDTASDFVWWKCLPNCRKCTPTFGYYPKKSSSYREVYCQDKEKCAADYLTIWGCDLDGLERCEYMIQYTDFSRTDGILAIEKVSGVTGETINDDLIFGCAESTEGSVGRFNISGLLGFGRGKYYSFVDQTNITQFSFCLVSHNSQTGSSLSLGWIPRLLTGTIRVPIASFSRLPFFYYVGFYGIYVGDEELEVASDVWVVQPNGTGGVIIDSGSMITKFPTGIYEKFRASFVRQTKDLISLPGEDGLDTCYDMSDPDDEVPLIAFRFLPYGHGTLLLETDQITMPIGTNGKYCLAFASTRAPYTVIGSWQFQRSRLSFNLPDSVINIDRDSCA